MIQVLPKARSFGEEFGRAIGTGAGQGFSDVAGEYRKQKELARENEDIFKATGIRLSSLDPDMRKMEFSEKLKGQERKSLFDEKMKSLQGISQDTYEETLEAEKDEETPSSNFSQEDGKLSPLKRAPAKHPQNKIDAMMLIDPDVAKSWIAHNKSVDTQKRHEEDLNLRTSQAERKEAIDFHKETAKLDEKISSEAQAAEKKIKAMKQQRKLQPEISNFDRIVSAVFRGNPLENLIKSSTAQQFDSFALPMVEGQKETFGVRLSDADLKLILQKIATSDKNPEANAAIMDWMTLEEEMKIEKRKIADEIRKENKGLRPLDYEAKIRERMNDIFGDEIDKRSTHILSLQDDQAKREKITGRREVPAGTPLNNEVIDKYLQLSNNDPEEAKRMALEDGYSF